MKCIRAYLAATALLISAGAARAQLFGPQTTITTPSHNISDSFYEYNGVDFDFDIGNFKFRQGSFDAVRPAVGGFQPNAGARGGFAFGKGKNQGRLRFNFGQGNTRTNSVQAPVLTIGNGQQGFVTNSTQTPFVTNVVPVVNNWQGPINGLPINFAAEPGFGQLPVTSVTPFYGNASSGLESRLRAAALAASAEDNRPRRPQPPADEAQPMSRDTNSQRLEAARGSSAGQPAPSIAAIRASQAGELAAEQRQALSYYERGQDAEKRGKAGVAKIYYRAALRTASGELREAIDAQLRTLEYRN